MVGYYKTSPDACKFVMPTTGAYVVAHDAVVTRADDEDEFDPGWLGPTINDHQYGYCSRCGQPFKWSGVKWGWREITKEAIAKEFNDHMDGVTERALRLHRKLRKELEAIRRNRPEEI